MARLRSDKSKKGGIDLLQQISAKDLRDVSSEVLIDHMMNSHLCANADYFRRFVRNPRVSNEMITPYKGFFEKAVPEQDREAYLADPMKLVTWVAGNIRVDKDCNLGARQSLRKGCGRPVQPMRTAVISSLYPWHAAWVFLHV